MSLFCLSFSPSALSSVLDLRPAKVAQQLALIEWELFSNIKPDDVSDSARCVDPQAARKLDRYRDIVAIVDLSTNIANWVAATVVEEKNIDKRARLMEHLMCIIDECRKLSNISTMAAMFSGLRAPPVFQLTQTWALVDIKKKKAFVACVEMVQPAMRFGRPRDVNRGLKSPCVPFLGAYLLKYPSNTPADGLYSREVAVEEIRRLQAASYKFKRDERIRTFLCSELRRCQGKTYSELDEKGRKLE